MMNSNRLTSLVPPRPATTSHPPLLRRKCSCGGECDSCRNEDDKKKKSLTLQTKLAVNTPGDSFETEADRIADAVMSGSGGAPLQTSSVKVQRDDTPPDHTGPATKKEPTDEEKYKAAAAKLSEAVRATPIGKELEAKATKLGKDFVSSLEGKVVAGTVLAGALAGIIATNSSLPVQIPEIPLDWISPGLKAKLTWEGPVQKPTNASLTITTKSGVQVAGGYTSTPASPGKPAEEKVGLSVTIPLGGSPTKKPAGSDADKYRAETAAMRADQDKFREGLKSPGEKAADKKFIDDYLKMKMNDPLNPLSLGGPRLFPITPSTAEPKKDDDKLQRRESGSGHTPATAPPIVHDVLGSPGSPLDNATRHFMESRFGHDFSHVRIHADSRAAESAKAVHAKAYTVGSNVVFASGEFTPASDAGRRLLAHELTHVLQQGSTSGGGPQHQSTVRGFRPNAISAARTVRRAVPSLQRKPDDATVKEFDDRVSKMKTLPEFVALKDAKALKELGEIITEARKRDDALYYIGKLELMFNTPKEASSTQAASFSGDIADAAKTESDRLATKEGQAESGKEEAVSKDATRVFTPMTGVDGKKYLIDARDVKNIAVQAKVRLQKKGKGTDADITNVKGLEDAIEKSASTLGYSVDLTFVNVDGPDVFSVGVDTSDWPTSGNWVSTAPALAHELHHLLGLDDRYNYIENHAGNAQMKIPDRIHWFRVQMDKPPDPQGSKSIMGGRNLPLDDDVCKVAQKTGADFDSCVQQRAQQFKDTLQPPTSKAFVSVFKAYSNMANIAPPSPMDKAGEPTVGDEKQKRVGQMAASIFGSGVSVDDVKDTVDRMRFALAVPNMFLVSALKPGCKNPTFIVPMAPRIRICPSFLSMAVDAQADALLLEAAHFVGVGDTSTDTACAKPDCSDQCVGKDNAPAWVKFVKCASGV